MKNVIGHIFLASCLMFQIGCASNIMNSKHIHAPEIEIYKSVLVRFVSDNVDDELQFIRIFTTFLENHDSSKKDVLIHRWKQFSNTKFYIKSDNSIQKLAMIKKENNIDALLLIQYEKDKLGLNNVRIRARFIDAASNDEIWNGVINRKKISEDYFVLLMSELCNSRLILWGENLVILDGGSTKQTP